MRGEKGEGEKGEGEKGEGEKGEGEKGSLPLSRQSNRFFSSPISFLIWSLASDTSVLGVVLSLLALLNRFGILDLSAALSVS